MVKTAHAVFEELASQGEKALEAMRKVAFSPESSKTLRHWGITEVSEMVSRSAQYIRQQEQENIIPRPTIDDNSNRRSYSLQHINHIRDHFNTRPKSPDVDAAAIIAFANFKGGAAKTTSAVNCAQFFAKQGYRVLLIDCDSQASATQIFGYVPDADIEENETMLPFLLDEADDLSKVIRKTYWDGLDLIPANLALYGAEFALPVKSAHAASKHEKFEFYSILSRGINDIKSSYDIIILDCPPSMGMISINAIFAANSIIIPSPPAMLDFTSTVQFFEMLHETMSRLPNKVYRFIRVMITKHDGRATSDTLVNILRQVYGNYVMTNIIYNSEVIKKAAAKMQTIYELDEYDGSKKTYERILMYSDSFHAELENLLKQTWTASEKNNEINDEITV